MRQLDTATKHKVEPLKACIATALFALETRPITKDDGEDTMPADCETETISNLKFSHFGNIVKPTPFQTYSTTFSSSTASSVSASPYSSESQITSFETVTGSLQAEDNKDRARSRSILKTGENSRYNRGF